MLFKYSAVQYGFLKDTIFFSATTLIHDFLGKTEKLLVGNLNKIIHIRRLNNRS